MSARLGIFQVESAASATRLQSVCLAENTTATWKQQNTEYTISGHSTDKQNFRGCYKNVLKIIENKLDAPDDLINKNLYAFSFYFDRLSNAKAIDEQGGEIELNKIAAKAQDGEIGTLDSLCTPNN
jgi:hypothetical protein